MWALREEGEACLEREREREIVSEGERKKEERRET